jgi:hypothetical protein
MVTGLTSNPHLGGVFTSTSTAVQPNQHSDSMNMNVKFANIFEVKSKGKRTNKTDTKDIRNR